MYSAPVDRDTGLICGQTIALNGFYAATKRKAEANGGDYEPTLAAATKNLGDRVEIRIRDNGTGIPPEVKEKLFNPFFTTKPAGEGTGLGLSISHDIIVKQHGGSIEVDTLPGCRRRKGLTTLLAERHARHLAERAQTLQGARKPMHTDPAARRSSV